MRSIIVFGLIIFSSVKLFATHISGGNISWRCQANGKFVFYAELYNRCNFVISGWGVETIQIKTNQFAQLPRDSANRVIREIDMHIDSVRLSLNVNCDTGSNSLCVRRITGTQKSYYFKSDPIELNGVPPDGGWIFYWNPFCCIGEFKNILQNNGNYLVLRAIMYPNAVGQNVNPCFDSSPEFAAGPQPIFCSSFEGNLMNTALDPDADSITYQWDTVRTYAFSHVPVIYASGYSFDQPTPDRNSHIKNKGSHLNAKTGDVSFRINLDSNAFPERFLLAIKSISWRNGKKIASVTKQTPITILNCDSSITPHPVAEPKIFLTDDSLGHDTIKVVAGQDIRYTVKAFSANTNNHIFMEADGNQFSTDFVDSNDCLLPLCAVLRNNSPVLDSGTRRYLIRSTDSLQTQFFWKTDLSHLQGDSCSVFTFNFRVTEENCPISFSASSSLTVVLGLDTSICSTVSLDQLSASSPELDIFPNPVKNELKIRSSEGIQLIQLRSLTGQLLNQVDVKDAKEYSLNLNLKSGIYFLELHLTDGTRILRKVVKQ